ncbi:hypothetical protein [Paraglaciecola arctica]|uniref:hypothetical protein n=1 Tax=Paraglaciecola arctica TaxID=1128911 RepID=UPI001D03F5ED|nr:hypothetical protein [Paraglaciecola arctica]
MFLGIATFGNGEAFDRLFIFILIFTGIICRKNIDVLGIVFILAFERILEEIFWFSSQDIWYSKVAVYSCLIIVLYKLKYDAMSRLALPCLVLSISAELYWFASDYQFTPEIYWYNILIGQSMVVRFLLFSRINLSYSIFNKKANSINLDWIIYQATRIFIVFETLNILEYLLRHILELKVTVIYVCYPFAMQIIATFILWAVFNEANKLLKTRILSA